MTQELSTRKEIAARIRALLELRKQNCDQFIELLAHRAVRRGAYWLNRHAPRGWWRNCLNVGRSRVRTSYSNEDVLCLAFEFDGRFANRFGYVVDYNITDHFKLSQRKAARLGFLVPYEGYLPYSRHQNVRITSTLLNRVWTDYLTNPTGEMLSNYRHPTAIDRRFATMDFWPEKPTLWDHIRRLFSRRAPSISH